jgi:hypothetical protein
LWTAICPILGSSSSLAHCRPFCLSSLCLLKVHMEISSFLPRFSSALRAPCPICCVFLFSSLFIIQFSGVWVFLQGRGQSVQGAMLVYPGVAVGVTCAAYLLTCWSVSPKVWSCCLAAWMLSVSQCNVAWRSLIRVVGSACRCFDSSWWFFLPSVAPASLAKLLIYGVYAVCFCPLVAILDPLSIFLHTDYLLA